jgi:hypothetical protein
VAFRAKKRAFAEIDECICSMSAIASAADDGEWVVLFYVPYANDLWRVASSVFGSISKAFAVAAKDSGRCRNVRVLMQYKLRGDLNMRRRHWHCDTSVEWADEDHVIHHHEEAKCETDSSRIESFRSFLAWTVPHVAAAMCVGVVVMGHGGGVMQFCPEEVQGGCAGALRWMDVGAAAAELVRFNDIISQRIGFVFLQNCCKASLPAIWPFRHLNCCLIASPTIIAAPNTYDLRHANRQKICNTLNSYYSALIHHLFTCPGASPASAAAVICNNEQCEDFAIFSVFDSAKLASFTAALDMYVSNVASLLQLPDVARALSDSLRCFGVDYAFFDEHGHSVTERYVDAMALCCALRNSIPAAAQPPLHALQVVQVCVSIRTKPPMCSESRRIPLPDCSSCAWCRPSQDLTAISADFCSRSPAPTTPPLRRARRRNRLDRQYVACHVWLLCCCCCCCVHCSRACLSVFHCFHRLRMKAVDMYGALPGLSMLHQAMAGAAIT